MLPSRSGNENWSALRRVFHAGRHAARVERGIDVALGREALVPGHAGPVLADEAAALVDLRVIEVCGGAVESRQPQLVAVHLAREEAVIAGRRQDRAGDLLERLRELGDARARLARVARERHGPAARDVGVVGQRLLEESPGRAELRGERQQLSLTSGSQQRHFTLELPAGDAGGQRVREARHRGRELSVGDRDVGDAHTLLAVDHGQHEAGFFLRDVEPERQLATRQLEHGTIAAGLQFATARAAAGHQRGQRKRGEKRSEQPRHGRQSFSAARILPTRFSPPWCFT